MEEKNRAITLLGSITISSDVDHMLHISCLDDIM